MAPLQIVGLGLAALDILVRTQDLPTWECGARLSALAIDGGGPVATALAAAQKLGAQTGYVGTYGSDRMGRIKLETLVEHGIDVSRAIQRPGAEEHAILVCVHGETGERIFSGIGHRSMQPLQVDELDRDYLTSAEFLHLDGTYMEAALQAARWMHVAGKRVMVDGPATQGQVSEDMRELVSLADILICGSGFGRGLTGKESIWEAGEALLDLGPGIVVQTEGKVGSYTSTRVKSSSPEGKYSFPQGLYSTPKGKYSSLHTPAFEVEVLDTTGAGDVFHGAYLVGLLHGWDLQQAALFSTAVSAMKCAQLGGRQGIPEFGQALAFLKERGIYLPEK